jgi:hypothetical protein
MLTLNEPQPLEEAALLGIGVRLAHKMNLE